MLGPPTFSTSHIRSVFAPAPKDIIAMTPAIPITMPNIVKNDLNLFDPKIENAVITPSNSFI